MADWIKIQNPSIHCLEENHFREMNHFIQTESEGTENSYFMQNEKWQESGNNMCYQTK